MLSQVNSEFIKSADKIRFHQGDILKDISFVIHSGFHIQNETRIATLSKVSLNYAVVVSQDCDLEHDFNNRNNKSSVNQDKFLPNLLILPAYLSEDFREGKHITDLKFESWSSDKWKTIKQNQNARFHFIKNSLDYQVPDLVIDFKHVYTLDNRVCYPDLLSAYFITIGELFRESISQRYTNFLGRIALPEL